MNRERNPSEIIQDFVDLMKKSQEKYAEAKKECERLDSQERHSYWCHKFEFSEDKSERNRYATALQKERRSRREKKDVCDLYRHINDFTKSDNNKSTLGRLKGMLTIQKRQEEYLQSEREYKGGNKTC